MRSVLLSLGLCLAPAALAACPLASDDPASFERLRRQDFAIDDAARLPSLALALVPCLSSPDPAVRDDTALAALTDWMRGGRLEVATLRELRELGYARLQNDDADGFTAPFTALMLAEVARTDRRSPWMDDAERAVMVGHAARYLQQVRDYRGFAPARAGATASPMAPTG